LRIFHPKEEFGAESGPGDSGGDYGPTDGRGERIAEAAAEQKIDAEGDEVGDSFEEDVGMDFVRTQRDVDGKLRGEME